MEIETSSIENQVIPTALRVTKVPVARAVHMPLLRASLVKRQVTEIATGKLP